MKPNPRKHNDHQRAHFDAGSLTNPRMMVADTPYVHRHVARLLAATDLQPGQRVLDVGCGLGKFTLPLADQGFDVVGLDLSPDLIQAAKPRLGGRSIELMVGDIVEPTPELIGQFDAVVGFFMLHHLLDLGSAFAGIRSCLKPGGTAAFLEPNAYSPLFPIQITFTPSMTWRSDYGVLKMRRARLRNAMAAAGFCEISHRWTGLFPPAIANRVGPGIEEALDRLPVPGAASSFQVIAARKAR